MKSIKMLKKSLVPTLFGICLLMGAAVTSCSKTDLYDPTYGKEPLPDPGTVPDFSTRTTVNLTVDYVAPSVKTPFEVYAEYPYLVQPDGSVVKKEIEPVFAAYTDDNGQFSGQMLLPTVVSTIFLCTPSLGLPRCVDVAVVNGTATYKRIDSVTSKSTRAQVITPGGSGVPYTVDPSKLLYSLCSWGSHGRPLDNGYLTTDPTLVAFANSLQRSLWNGSLTKPGGLNNSNKIVSEQYTNISIATQMVVDGQVLTVKDAGIRLAFLNEGAWYQNTLGYYYYPTDKRPADPSKVKKYILLPNASTPGSVPFDGYTFSQSSAPVRACSWVSLKYIDDNGQVFDRFPPGYTIGWFVISDGFQYRNGTEYLDTGRQFIYSNQSWNGNGKSSCITLTDNTTGRVVVGFEDGGDLSYEDLLFEVEADPSAAIYDPNKPSISGGTIVLPEQEYAISGTLAFEDNWPESGDYDLNDVVIEYKRVVTFDNQNQVKKLTDHFKPVQKPDGALFTNAFAYQVDATQLGSFAPLPEGVEYEAATNSFIVFTNAKTAIGKESVITRTFSGGAMFNKSTLKPYNPYIIVRYAPANKKRVEVHLPKFKATSYADQTLIGTLNDVYYADKSGRFPFAIDLPVTGFKLVTEHVRIGSNSEYPLYGKWVDGGCGTASADWYLHK
ncbi:MAG: LruC domain-containing protein [Bacteroides sp.]|uniref:LruC domain-containing protein n=1 Tax=Bacteroides sp. TaxID=29523 RepID=UPI002FC652FE